MFRDRILKNEASVIPVDCVYIENGQSFFTTAQMIDVQYDRMYDIVTPRFKEFSARGELVFSPMYRQQTFVKTTSAGKIHIEATNINGDCVGDWGFSVPIDYPYINPLSVEQIDVLFESFSGNRDAALTGAFAGVDITILQLGASVGEGPETLRFMVQALKRLATLLAILDNKKAKLQAIRTLRKMSPKQYVSAIQDIWMEFRYAIRPLVFEIAAAIKLLAELQKPERYTSRDYASAKASVTDNSVYYMPGTSELSYNVMSKETTKYKCRSGVLYSANDDSAYDMVNLLGLDKPISTIWELTTLSFVMDWVFSLGDYIAQWEGNSSLTVLGAWTTETLELSNTARATSTTCNWENFGYSNVECTVGGDGMTTANRIYKRRLVDQTRPTFPAFNLKLNASKLIDLLAITKNLWKGLMPLAALVKELNNVSEHN